VAPQGYNNTICNYGDIGVANVYFLINRYIGKTNNLDVLNATVRIHVVNNGYTISYTLNSEDSIKLYSPEILNRQSEGLVFINWEVPEEITAGIHGAQNLKISLEFEFEGKRWFSNTYTNLRIGTSVLEINADPGATNELAVYYYIEKFFADNDVTFDANAI
jgi:hypothetical protein